MFKKRDIEFCMCHCRPERHQAEVNAVMIIKIIKIIKIILGPCSLWMTLFGFVLVCLSFGVKYRLVCLFCLVINKTFILLSTLPLCLPFQTGYCYLCNMNSIFIHIKTFLVCKVKTLLSKWENPISEAGLGDSGTEKLLTGRDFSYFIQNGKLSYIHYYI